MRIYLEEIKFLPFKHVNSQTVREPYGGKIGRHRALCNVLSVRAGAWWRGGEGKSKFTVLRNMAVRC